MKTMLTAAFVLIAIPLSILAQGPFDGRWESRDGATAIFEFQITGQKLSGTLSLVDLPGQSPQPLEGKVDGEYIAFSVQSKDKARMIAFVGKLTSNGIELRRDASGNPPPAGGGGPMIYSLDGPKTVTLKKVK